MASMDKPPLGTSTVKWRFPDIHPEGRKYVAIAAAIALASLFIFDFITWPLVFLAFGVAAFFRDPIRVTPQGEGMLIAPADGLVTMIQPVELPPELRGPQALGDAPMVRVSIFMSVFDVHVNRTPITGTIRHVIYISGRFLNADLDKASEDNERNAVVIESVHGPVGCIQIAGLIARRILCFVKQGEDIAPGARFGLIRFGSRTDVYVATDSKPLVAEGQRAIGGETVLIDLKSTETQRHFRIA